MEERTYTTQTDLNPNHAVVRGIGGAQSPLTTVRTKTAAGACIFCVAKKANSYVVLTLQSTPLFWLARNLLRSNIVFTSPKNNILCECDIGKIKQRVANRLVAQRLAERLEKQKCVIARPDPIFPIFPIFLFSCKRHEHTKN